MKYIAVLFAGLIAATLFGGCNPEPEQESGSQPLSNAEIPLELQAGENLYNDHCSECHGVRGSGADQGNPLVDIIYEPGHHGDASFQAAVANGAQQHHWQFGDMEPVPDVSQDQVTEITEYIRFLQRQVGIE